MIMDHVSTLVAQYFNISDNVLQIGGLPVDVIVAKYDTPLFIYDSQVLDCTWALLRSTLPPVFAVYYSVKANPNLTLLQYFLAKGCGLEIASGGELSLALHAGCPPQKLLFAGPGKTAAELEWALQHDIGEIHVESLVEAERISAIS